MRIYRENRVELERISGGGMKWLLEWRLKKTWRYYKEGLEHREERGLDKGI